MNSLMKYKKKLGKLQTYSVNRYLKIKNTF